MAQILTPAELAHQVEQLDDEDWYDFLDELDEVSRRRCHASPNRQSRRVRVATKSLLG